MKFITLMIGQYGQLKLKNGENINYTNQKFGREITNTGPSLVKKTGVLQFLLILIIINDRYLKKK